MFDNESDTTAFFTKNNAIDRAQIGFMPKRRTTDHIFTFKTECNKYVKDKDGGKLFACFVNFNKAYDSIWHEGLFHKQITNQVNGQFSSILFVKRRQPETGTDFAFNRKRVRPLHPRSRGNTHITIHSFKTIVNF